MMARTKLLLIALCLYAVCASVDADPDTMEQEAEDPAVLSPAFDAAQLAMPCGAKGKYFRVVSQHVPAHAMDVYGAQTGAGTSIIMFSHYGKNHNNQLWTYDRVYRVIRSYLNEDKVMTLSGDYLVMGDFSETHDNQLFEPKTPVIYHGFPNKYCLEITGASTGLRAQIINGSYRGESHQHWTIDYTRPRFCYIRSRLNDKVWTVTSTRTGAIVELQNKYSTQNESQLWWEDSNGLVRSAANGEIVITRNFQLYTSAIGDGQEWVKSGLYIHGLHTYGHRTVLEIQGGSSNGTQIAPMIKKPGSYQHWEFDYVTGLTP